MADELFICIASCSSDNNTGAMIGNDTYDLECITQCSQRHTSLYHNTAQKYVEIFIEQKCHQDKSSIIMFESRENKTLKQKTTKEE